MTEFLDSMPEAYRHAHIASDAATHAQIVARRGPRLAHAELCHVRGKLVVCVVADDRPGLLALVTDALLVHGLRIFSAQAYCRTRRGAVTEAVDFLELRQRTSGPGSDFDPTDIAAFVQTLTELIAEDIRATARESAAPAPNRSQARAYFELEALRRGDYVLLVEAPDTDGLLHAISSALHAQGVRILACQIATEAGVARDRFELADAAGEPLTGANLCDIQLAVLQALPRSRP